MLNPQDLPPTIGGLAVIPEITRTRKPHSGKAPLSKREGESRAEMGLVPLSFNDLINIIGEKQ